MIQTLSKRPSPLLFSQSTLTGHHGIVLVLRKHLNWLFSGSRDRCVSIWDLEGKQLLWNHKFPGVIDCLELSPDNGSFICTSEKQVFVGEFPSPSPSTVKFTSPKTEDQVYCVTQHGMWTSTLHATEHIIASGSMDGTLTIVDFSNVKKRNTKKSLSLSAWIKRFTHKKSTSIG
jgi:WD40 repeat protein